MSFCWCGPLLAFRADDNDDPSQDVQVCDLSHIADGFQEYTASSTTSLESWLRRGKLGELQKSNPALFIAIQDKYTNAQTIKGVEIGCVADTMLLQKKKFASVTVLANNPIFGSSSKPTSISKQIQLPIFVKKNSNADEHSEPVFLWQATGRTIRHPGKNIEAVSLNRITNTMSRFFGITDLKHWDKDVGRVLVVRADKKDITPNQVSALVCFPSNASL